MSGRRGRYDPRQLLLHYALTLFLVVGVLVSGALLHVQALRLGAVEAEVATEIASKRALSQRVLFLASEYHGRGMSTDEALLDSEIVLFENTSVRLHEEVGAIRGAVGFDAEARFRAFLFAEAAREVAAAPPGSAAGAEALGTMRRSALPGLMAALDSMAIRLEAAMREARRAHLGRERVLIGFALAFFLLEGALVFWPAHRAAIAAFGKLRSHNSAILKKNEALESQTRQLEVSAFHDPLTGLNNRTKLYEHLNRILASGGSERDRLCVLHIDLDHFKELNDSHGHAMGDAALRHLSGIMSARVRRGDLVARVGGDEFVIALHLRDAEAAASVDEIARRLIKEIREPMVVDGTDLRLGASIGYAFATEETRDADMLIAHADLALYEAKRAGRGVARAFTSEMKAQVTRRKAMAGDMEHGLETGAFVPYVQPLVSLETGAVERIEMLALWQHPERGLIHPSEFMPVAEEIGVIDAIEARVFIDGLDALGALRQERGSLPPLAINASSRTMRYEDYAERLTDAVRARGFEPPEIIIEILESSLVADTRDQTAETISKLRALGYDVHVDDFGTGYSSLLNLARLDVNGLKIDRTLIAAIEQPRSRQIVRAIIGLAQAMSMTVSADGVETDAQWDELRWLGAATAQGTAIAPAMIPQALGTWLAGHSGDLNRRAPRLKPAS